MVSANTTIKGVNYNSSVRAYNPLTGDLVWQRGLSQTSYYGYAAPLYVNKLLIVADQGTLFVFNPKNGSVVYQDTVGGSFIAAPSVSRGEIFVGSSTGYVYAFGLPPADQSRQSPELSAHSPSLGWGASVGLARPLYVRTTGDDRP